MKKTLVAVIPPETLIKAKNLLTSASSGRAELGRHVRDSLRRVGVESLGKLDLIKALFRTRQPTLFAEKCVAGDGSDWTLDELSILGDVSIAARVEIFDNGAHSNPIAHTKPFDGTLIFVAGALLENGLGLVPADWQEVVSDGADVSQVGLLQLYRRRLVPVFTYINACSTKEQPALVTVPGIGCGMFSGRFHGSMGRRLEEVLRQLLKEHGNSWPNIRAVHFDPYQECSNRAEIINGIFFNVRPSRAPGNNLLPQLCKPDDYSLEGENFSHCQLFSLVAWDPVSWPGNDFYSGWRSTDDGVKAAATNAMFLTTGVEGFYCAERNCYMPPGKFLTWEQVVECFSGRVHFTDRTWFGWQG